MNITMFPMGFGESILIHEGDSCLLVDCGSESPCKNDYFANVVREVQRYEKRSLLISHFHTDHINGIKYICEQYRGAFNNVYVPNIFSGGNRALDVLITQCLLEGVINQRRKPYQIWNLLLDLVKARLSIVPLKRGDIFNVANCDFQVLWPIPEDVELNNFVRNINLGIPYYDEVFSNVESLIGKLREITLWLSTPNKTDEEYTEYEIMLEMLVQNFSNLQIEYIEIIKSNIGLRKFRRMIQESYNMLSNVNDNSVVFQSKSYSQKQILMTGDVRTSILKRIINNYDVPSVSVRNHYEVFKAPHHGTESSFLKLSTYFDFDRLLISNGETTYSEKKRGKISKIYLSPVATYKVICTNTIKSRCESAPNSSNDQCPACCGCCRADPVKTDV